jgi:putative transposase
VGFEQWLAQHLLPSLKIPSVLIMDNSQIHRNNVLKELVEGESHQLLFLQKYFHYLNDI